MKKKKTLQKIKGAKKKKMKCNRKRQRLKPEEMEKYCKNE